jgi:hypothetical protein
MSLSPTVKSVVCRIGNQDQVCQHAETLSQSFSTSQISASWERDQRVSENYHTRLSLIVGADGKLSRLQ